VLLSCRNLAQEQGGHAIAAKHTRRAGKGPLTQCICQQRRGTLELRSTSERRRDALGPGWPPCQQRVQRPVVLRSIVSAAAAAVT